MANPQLSASDLQKGKTRKQLKASRARLQAKVEREENKKVVERSGGRCEVMVEHGLTLPDGYVHDPVVILCRRRATQVHHMIGKWRLRGRGKSALAEHKQHVCETCHTAITGDVNNKLVRVGGPVPHYTDWYRRAA